MLPGDPTWDIEAALGFLDWWDGPDGVDGWVGAWPRVPGDVARRRLEEFVGRAPAALGSN